MKTNWPFYLIALSVFIFITSFELLADGMFFDGVYYANFSKMMGLHFEGFWSLKNCISCNNLYGHPPLAIYLESIFFKIFGDSIYVERIFSVSTYFISGFLIHLILKQLKFFKNNNSWFVLLLWVVMPLVTWGANNNMLENTMTVFVLLSVLFSFFSLKRKNNFFIFISGIAMTLAFLTKGFTALFPLIFFVIYYLFIKEIRFKEAIISTFYLIVSFLFPFVLIFLFNDKGSNYLIEYINKQVIHSLVNVTTVTSRFNILFNLLNEILVPLIISLLLMVFYRKTLVLSIKNENVKWATFFIILGFSGVLPIIISQKQSSFYIISTLPFFAIGIGLLVSDQILLLEEKLQQTSILKGVKTFAVILFFVGLGIHLSKLGNLGRDFKKLPDVYAVINKIGDDKLSISHEIYRDWSLKAYFFRYGGISLTSNQKDLQNYYLIEKSKTSDALQFYKKMDFDLNTYDLYQKK